MRISSPRKGWAEQGVGRPGERGRGVAGSAGGIRSRAQVVDEGLERGRRGRFHLQLFRSDPGATSPLRRSLRWAAQLVLAAADVSTETRTVTAGRPEYGRHSSFWRFHFGEGYRDLWTTPFEVEVLDLRTHKGGLTPVRQVGSMQSIGLALRGGDGRSYTFRTLDKDPTRILPPEWRTTLPAQIFQDQTAAANLS